MSFKPNFVKSKHVDSFISWAESYFEVVDFITRNENNPAILALTEDAGRVYMYEVARDWTNEFQNKYSFADWQKLDFFDEIESFLKNKLNQL